MCGIRGGLQLTAKEYLKQLETLQMKIKHKKKELKEAEMEVGICIRDQGEHVQTSFCGSSGRSTEEQAVRIASLKSEIQERIIEYHEMKDKIVNQIHGLNNSLYIDILYRRYVDCEKNFAKIACDMSYAYKYVINIHGEALQAFEAAYQEVLAA